MPDAGNRQKRRKEQEMSTNCKDEEFVSDELYELFAEYGRQWDPDTRSTSTAKRVVEFMLVDEVSPDRGEFIGDQDARALRGPKGVAHKYVCDVRLVLVATRIGEKVYLSVADDNGRLLAYGGQAELAAMLGDHAQKHVRPSSMKVPAKERNKK